MHPIATIASTISGEITVYRDPETGLLTYTQGGYEQSAADRNGVSTATYIHAIYGLVMQMRARASSSSVAAAGRLRACWPRPART